MTVESLEAKDSLCNCVAVLCGLGMACNSVLVQNFATDGRRLFFLYLRTGVKKKVPVRKKTIAKNNKQWLALFK